MSHTVMEAGLAKRPMEIWEIAELAPIEAPKVRGEYKNKMSN